LVPQDNYSAWIRSSRFNEYKNVLENVQLLYNHLCKGQSNWEQKAMGNLKRHKVQQLEEHVLGNKELQSRSKDKVKQMREKRPWKWKRKWKEGQGIKHREQGVENVIQGWMQERKQKKEKRKDTRVIW
jgi:hypothetical protein